MKYEISESPKTSNEGGPIYRCEGGSWIWIEQVCGSWFWIEQVWYLLGFEFKQIQQFKQKAITVRALFGCALIPKQFISVWNREGPCLDEQKIQTNLIWILDFILIKNKIKFKCFWPKKIRSPTTHLAPAPKPSPPGRTVAAARARVWWFLGPMCLAHFAHNLSL